MLLSLKINRMNNRGIEKIKVLINIKIHNHGKELKEVSKKYIVYSDNFDQFGK